MIRRPPRSTLSSSSAASDVYKRQHGYYSSHYAGHGIDIGKVKGKTMNSANTNIARTIEICRANGANWMCTANKKLTNCASHTTWTHCQWNSWRSEVSRADMRKKGWPAV
eukprot:TRINITY_DN3896_c0_g1_i1.p1 TRINITY_DN3896_c0_g1~~TRINITY_DN3896_c0_g1_i1.p1  ORF type:complete len:110 (+),score=24.04 TRINITY_DN3896_c0_g1_i1:94-423(+)